MGSGSVSYDLTYQGFLKRAHSFHRAPKTRPTMKYNSAFKAREIAHKIKFAVVPKSIPANDVSI